MAWNTKTKIFNLPLLSIGGYARGVIAIGWMGSGIITIAQFGYGVVLIAQFGVGFICLTQFGLGFFVLAQFALGLIFAMGQMALGFISLGAGGIGYYGNAFGKNLDEQFRGAYYQVLEHPAPLFWWTAFLVIISIYVFSRRASITLHMSILDLFRPRIRHSVEYIRSKAVALLKNERKLLEIAQNDPSLEIRRDALQRISNGKLLLEFMRSDQPDELKIIVIRKISDEKALMDVLKSDISNSLRMEIIDHLKTEKYLAEAALFVKSLKDKTAAIKKITDQDLLLEMVLHETDTGIVKMVLGKMNSKKNFARIAREGASPHARFLALEKMDAGDEAVLGEIALHDGDNTVRKQAAGRVHGHDLLVKIALGDKDSGVRIAALNRLEDKKVLAEIARGGGDKAVMKAALDRLETIKPFYNSYTVEMSCPSCSQPLFLNGPVRNIKCGFCLKSARIRDSVWKRVLDAEFGVSRADSLNNLIIGKAIENALCRHCGGALDADETHDDSSADLLCGSCGKGNPSFPLPEWFTWAGHGNHVFCADHETGDSELDEKKEPVAISCIKCGGPLEIRNNTPRSTRCSYCNTVQYLPDPLWLSFHPVKTKKSWTIRFHYREREKIKKSRGKV